MASQVGMAVLLLSMRGCLAIVFLLAAVRKLANRRDFLQGTIDYQILPIGLAEVAGRLLPWIELLVGLALLLGAVLPVTSAVATVLLGAFIAAVVVNLRRGRQIDCNCYGIAGTATISWGTVGRNGVLLAMALAVAGLGVALPQGNWVTIFFTDRSLLSSTPNLILVALLLCWCLVLVYLVEWGLDIHLRVSELQMPGSREGG